ncbi:hypothetical protein QPM17_03770 [Marinobacter sp. TBZ242]|uniref:Uncharacterized protein n=1 Tax=Marinobacter azerbaijanicus TaxID=3050455 RepID=A0ABT7I8U4_9GAMM|nr:hypothetical protein [Marinobacter sp. TBZ242]MDL0430227.1 hypothetical protein [Marinobacter sp. TBZ242]
MSKEFSFFHRGTNAINADEFKRLNSPEVIGQELVLNVKGWIEKALSELSRHPGTMTAIDLEAPDWIDLSLPDHAVHELHRICLELPEHMPPGGCVETLAPDEKDAVEVLYRIKRLSNTLKGLDVPAASALVIINASLDLGTTAARVTVEKWEPDVADRHKSKTALLEHSKGTPEGSANHQKTEISKREHEKWILAAKEYWAKNSYQSPGDIAKKLKVELELSQTEDWIRKKISPAKPPKKVGSAR